jgi:hypothetical protein
VAGRNFILVFNTVHTSTVLHVFTILLLPLLDFSIFRSDSLITNLGLPLHPERVKLVAWNRFAALSRELEHTAEDLQQLRPSKGDIGWASAVDTDGSGTF